MGGELWGNANYHTRTSVRRGGLCDEGCVLKDRSGWWTPKNSKDGCLVDGIGSPDQDKGRW